MRRPQTVRTLGLAAAALLLAACGGIQARAPEPDERTTALIEEFNGLSGQERTDKLVELAQKEGRLTVYTSNPDMDEIVAAFEKKYAVDVEFTRGNSETVLQKLLAEGNSGDLDVDFVDNNANELNIMAEQGFFADYQSEYRDAVRPEGRFDGWTASYYNAFVVGWNTDEVESSEIPGELKDFADPRWKDRISLELGDIDWYAAVSTYYLDRGMSQAEVDTMWKAIAANASTEKGHSSMADMLAAGKLEITLSMYRYLIEGKAQEAGAPVAWKSGQSYVKPVMMRPFGVGIMATAKHPAAALLFMDYVLSEGQQVVANLGRIPSVETIPSPMAGIETLPVPEKEMAGARFEHWDDKYRDLVGG